MTTSILWLRRDLRLRDHPALLAAAEGGDVVPLFVLDDRLLTPAGAPRLAFLLRALRSLDHDLQQHGGRLAVRSGRPEQVVADLAREVGADAVHVSEDFAPYGAARDARVEAALGATPLVRTGSPYAVAPGRLLTGGGTPYRVFTPFYRAWAEHGWRDPADSDPAGVTWRVVEGDAIPDDPDLGATTLPEAAEDAALRAWRDFDASSYDDVRNRPDLDATSRLSPYLRFGLVHPRTLLAGLGPDGEPFRRQLAWRDFYAAVLHFWPESAHDYFRPELRALPYVTGAEAEHRLSAWAAGRTGYPIVDAGMRQLAGEGWMHNRVRLIVASFLVKDLHVEWQRGAEHFMRHLVDGDLASNQHNWQWVAGSGTDPAPYFRIFNPVTQGEKFDPAGDYIRRWVPELADLRAPEVHRPWRAGPPTGYPEPVVDHAEQRAAALDAYQQLRQEGRA